MTVFCFGAQQNDSQHSDLTNFWHPQAARLPDEHNQTFSSSKSYFRICS